MSNRQAMYGIVTRNHGFVDISPSLIGTKRYATKHGWYAIHRRDVMTNQVWLMSNKVNGKWEDL